MFNREADSRMHIPRTLPAFHRRAATATVGILSAIVMGAAVSHAQPTVDLAAMPRCASCELVVRQIALLGTDDGGGMIEKNHAQVRHDSSSGMYAVFHAGGVHVALFNRGGRFQRTIGRRGRGPGELEAVIDAHVGSRSITVVDVAGAKLVTYDPRGAVLYEARLPSGAGPVRPALTPNAVILGRVARASSGSYSSPLHVVRIDSGRVERTFGPTHGSVIGTGLAAGRVLLGQSAGRDVWIGNPGAFVFEQWSSADGRLLRRVQGNLTWGPGRVSSESGMRLPAAVLAFGVDARDRLFIVTQVPEGLASPRKTRSGEHLIREEDADEVFDTRIDVFDLGARRHVGTVRWDQGFAGLVEIGGRMGVQRVTLDEASRPRVAVYTIDVTRPSGHTR